MPQTTKRTRSTKSQKKARKASSPEAAQSQPTSTTLANTDEATPVDLTVHEDTLLKSPISISHVDLPAEAPPKEQMIAGPPSPVQSSRKRKRSVSENQMRPKPNKKARVIENPKRGASTRADSEPREEGEMPKTPNFESVHFGRYGMKPWYYSPYPEDNEGEDLSTVERERAMEKIGAFERKRSPTEVQPRICVCDRCFKYQRDMKLTARHNRVCPRKIPPGRKVYEDGPLAIWAVDGATDQLYCQNLSLFGKLFIHTKTIFFDTDQFLFYVLTRREAEVDQPLGYFAKEKWSYDNHNLACIIVFPPHQRHGYGNLMIEFSYEVSRWEGYIGSPERPLSVMGLKSYLTYWTKAIINFLREATSSNESILNREAPPDTRPTRIEVTYTQEGAVEKSTPMGPPAYDVHKLGIIPRFSLLSLSSSDDEHPGTSKIAHSFECTIEQIAMGSNLNVEDTAFTLHYLGFLDTTQTGTPANSGSEEVISIARGKIEEITKKYNVKRLIDVENVLLSLRHSS